MGRRLEEGSGGEEDESWERKDITFLNLRVG